MAVDSNWAKIMEAAGAGKSHPSRPAAAGAAAAAAAKPTPKTRDERDNYAYIKAPFPPSERNKGVYEGVTVTKFLGLDCEMVRCGAVSLCP